MTLFSASRKLCKGLLGGAVVAAMGLAAASCDSAIFDDQGDCSVHYRLSFRYTANLLDADAFGSQVSKVNVALYDRQGNMVVSKTESRALTTENDYYMDVDVRPGVYDIVAWCEGASIVSSATSFTLLGQGAGDKLTASGAQLPLEGQAPDFYSSKDVNRLYYGSLTGVSFPDTYGTVDIQPVPLIKDTNHILVQLQNMNNQPIDPAILDFRIEGAASQLSWQNLPSTPAPFSFRPWIVSSIYSSMDPEQACGTVADSDLPVGVQAEFTTSRLMAGHEQRLTVSLRETGEEILSIPLVEYLLMVRGHYQQAVSSQDYLDRYDDFTLLFFIDESYTWIKSRVYINNWRIVPPQDSHL